MGNCLKRSCPVCRGVGQIKNIFSLILRSTCYFSRGLHLGCGPQDYVFLRKNAGICRRVVGWSNLSKWKSVFNEMFLKFETNVRMMRSRVDFSFWKGRQKYFFSLALNNDNLNEKGFWYRWRNKDSVQCSYEVLPRRRFLKSFSPSFSFSNLLFIF